MFAPHMGQICLVWVVSCLLTALASPDDNNHEFELLIEWLLG